MQPKRKWDEKRRDTRISVLPKKESKSLRKAWPMWCDQNQIEAWLIMRFLITKTQNESLNCKGNGREKKEIVFNCVCLRLSFLLPSYLRLIWKNQFDKKMQKNRMDTSPFRFFVTLFFFWPIVTLFLKKFTYSNIVLTFEEIRFSTKKFFEEIK